MSASTTFPNTEALRAHLLAKGKGAHLITYRLCEGYPGMALALMIVFDVPKGIFQLDLQWMSLGLDLYGDTLQETYVYEFESLESLLAYLQKTYNIDVTDIPLKYTFDQSQFPDPIKDAEQKLVFEAAWQRFQVDFREGAFWDGEVKVVYASV